MRRFLTLLAATLLFAALPLLAQEDTPPDQTDVPLGDVARAVRTSKPTEQQEVIDNDNLPVMMDKAEAERLDGKPVFSIDPSGKSFRMTSPDGTCSLAFDAHAAALISTPYLSSDLPSFELAKLESTAAIHDGVLEVTLRNTSEWNLKELTVGVTLLNSAATRMEAARLVETVDSQLESKLPDATAVYHLKSTAAPGATVVFRAIISDELAESLAQNNDKDWHWALVSARGLPPAPALSPTASGASPANQSGSSLPAVITSSSKSAASPSPVSSSLPATR